MDSVQVIPSDKPAGAEILGVNIAAGVSEGQFTTIRDALHRHKVIVLRHQSISPAQQIGFSARFGRNERHVLPQFLVPGHEELVRVSNVLDEAGQPIGLVDAGRVWHTDGHFLPRPNMYSMLYALEVPHDDQGRPLGATLFCNTAHAWARLPAATQARIAHLRSANSLANVYRRMHAEKAAINRPPLTEAQKREAIHPVVRTHPVTGERCLYVSRAATSRIIDLPDAESDTLIGELADWCVDEAFVHTHRWQVGDLLMWDNCASQHLAVGDYTLPQRRLLHRTTVGGSETF